MNRPTSTADDWRRHCDLLDQAWKLLQGAWDAQEDEAWRTGTKKWRDAYFAVWSEHCGHNPGPAPYGLPVYNNTKGERDEQA